MHKGLKHRPEDRLPVNDAPKAQIPAWNHRNDANAIISVKSDGGVWYIDYASNGFGAWNASSSGWSGSTFQAVPRAYDGDHKADLATYNGLNDSWRIDFARDSFGTAVVILETP